MKRILSLLCALIVVCSLPTTLRAEDEYTRVERILHSLELGKIDFRDESLADVLEWLSDVTKISFVMTQSLDEEDPEVKITLRQGKTPYTFLKILGKRQSLEFYFQSGVVMVAMAGDNSIEKPILRVYNVTTLQFKTTDFPGPEIELTGGGDGGFGMGDVEIGEDDSEPLTADDIGDMLQELTGGGEWADETSVRVEAGMLLVTQTPRVHAEIAALLQQLQNLD